MMSVLINFWGTYAYIKILWYIWYRCCHFFRFYSYFLVLQSGVGYANERRKKKFSVSTKERDRCTSVGDMP